MTTSADPAPTPATPDASPSELSEIWRAIGRLEGTAAALLEGQREIKNGQEQLKQELRAESQAGQRELRAEFQAGQQELRAEFQAGQRELRAEFQAGFLEVNRRIDRLFYTILAGGGALLVAIFASRFVGS